MLRQVDGLVDYFGGLLDGDRAEIEKLEGRLASRDAEIAELRRRQPRPVPPGPNPPPPPPPPRRWRCWIWCAVVTAALLALIIGLAAGLGARRRTAAAAAPEFLFAPVALAAPDGSALDLRLAVTRAGATVHYVVVPRTTQQPPATSRAGSSGTTTTDASAQLLGDHPGRSIIAASAGLLGGSVLEGAAVACGRLPVPVAGANVTLSIAGAAAAAASAECGQQRSALTARAGRAGQVSCARCPTLVAGANYTVWLVPGGGGGGGTAAVGAPASVKAATSTSWGATALLGGAGASNETSIAVARVAAAGDSAFNLTFGLTAPGALHFAVVYAAMSARFVESYVAFDNAPGDAAALVGGDLTAFSGGVVARGSCSVPRAGVVTSCRIGPAAANDGPGTYACTSIGGGGSGGAGAGGAAAAVSCTVQNACFGALCEFSRFGVAPGTAYKVVLVPQGSAGGLGAPRVAGSFRTLAPQSAPQPLGSLRVEEGGVGADRISLAGVGQDRPGFVYVLVVRQAAQRAAAERIAAGTATNFTQLQLVTSAAAADDDGGGVTPQLLLLQQQQQQQLLRHRRRARQLLASVGGANLTVLPPETAPPGAGATFLPQCPQGLACNPAAAIAAFVPEGAAAVAHSECVPVQRITDEAGVLAPGLADDTVYRVVAVTADPAGRQAAWQAVVRTRDATPPQLTVVELPPPLFTSFQVVVALSEPGTVYAALALEAAADADPAAAGNASLALAAASDANSSATCPPQFAVRRRKRCMHIGQHRVFSVCEPCIPNL